MPKFEIEYIETVKSTCVIEANDKEKAFGIFYDGEFTDAKELEAYDAEIKTIIEMK